MKALAINAQLVPMVMSLNTPEMLSAIPTARALPYSDILCAVKNATLHNNVIFFIP